MKLFNIKIRRLKRLLILLTIRIRMEMLLREMLLREMLLREMSIECVGSASLPLEGSGDVGAGKDQLPDAAGLQSLTAPPLHAFPTGRR